jgi:hypothetical protein
LQNSGNEIGSHSNNHLDFPTLSDTQINQECQISKQTLQSWGLSVNNFAYPDAARNAHADSIVAQYYRSARSGYVTPYVMSFPTSQFVLNAMDGSVALSADTSLVDQVYSANGWAVIIFHDITPTSGFWQNHISSADFASFLNYVQAKGVAVLTVNQALSSVSNPTPTATSAPTPTPAPSGGSTIVGDSNVEGSNGGAYSNFIIGSRATVPQTCTTSTISIYSGSSGANAKLAIYSDNSGALGSLLAQSSPIALGAGWNTASLSSATLSGGSRVWLVWLCDKDLANGMRYATSSANQGFYVWQPYSSGFPTTISGPVYTNGIYSIYATCKTS